MASPFQSSNVQTSAAMNAPANQYMTPAPSTNTINARVAAVPQPTPPPPVVAPTYAVPKQPMQSQAAPVNTTIAPISTENPTTPITPVPSAPQGFNVNDILGIPKAEAQVSPQMSQVPPSSSVFTPDKVAQMRTKMADSVVLQTLYNNPDAKDFRAQVDKAMPYFNQQSKDWQDNMFPTAMLNDFYKAQVPTVGDPAAAALLNGMTQPQQTGFWQTVGGGKDPSVSGLIGNTIGSAGKFIGGMANALSPVGFDNSGFHLQMPAMISQAPDTAKAFIGAATTAGTAAADAARSALGLPEASPQSGLHIGQDQWNSFNQATQQKYGSVANLLHTLYTDPVQVAADISAITGAGGMTAGAFGAPEAAATMGKISNATNPVNAVIKTGEVATNLAQQELGAMSGGGKGLIEGALKTEGTPTQVITGNPNDTFVRAMSGDLGPDEILANAKEAFAKAQQDGIQQHIAGTTAMKDMPVTTPLNDILAQSLRNSKVTPAGTNALMSMAKDLSDSESTALLDKMMNVKPSEVNTSDVPDMGKSNFVNPADKGLVIRAVNEVNNFANEPQNIGTFDSLKTRLQSMVNYDHPLTPGEKFVTGLASKVRDAAATDVPQYGDLMKNSEAAIQDMNNMSTALKLGKKANIDSALTKLSGTMKDMIPRNERAKVLLDSLDQTTGAEIQKQVAGMTASHALPLGLMRQITSGGIALGAVKLLSPHFWAGFALASPRVQGEIFSRMGIAKNLIAPTLAKIPPQLVNAFKTGVAANTSLQNGLTPAAQ